MTLEMSDDERLVRDWLSERGYLEPEYEPVKIGRRPDFLAVANRDGITPDPLWAEVKSLGPEDSVVALSRTWPVLKDLGVPKGINGYATLHVNELTREQSVRALLKMFYGKATTHASEKVQLSFIQEHSEKRDVRYLEIRGEVQQKIWVRGAGGEKMSMPPGIMDDGSRTVSSERAGRSEERPAFDVFDWTSPFDCALDTHIDPRNRPLTAISSMASGSSSLRSRALSAIEDANSQIRNAYASKVAPGVVFLVPAEDHADDQIIAMAAYGELTVPVSLQTNVLGEAYYGRNGAFRRDKNRHISAAIRLRRKGGTATYFPNPFAKEPIDERASLFSGLNRGPVSFI
jgi:hypothetical protein